MNPVDLIFSVIVFVFSIVSLLYAVISRRLQRALIGFLACTVLMCIAIAHTNLPVLAIVALSITLGTFVALAAISPMMYIETRERGVWSYILPLVIGLVLLVLILPILVRPIHPPQLSWSLDPFVSVLLLAHGLFIVVTAFTMRLIIREGEKI